ncbi:cation:proton antiporter [Glycomyces salinus]|uniref:cation:proton antiporter n=1 Tax=Glycomyces salinus TaxID=980294 RepID=UPI0018EACF91|nr:cation:proton antiporter [Glycomyces salinus]
MEITVAEQDAFALVAVAFAAVLAPLVADRLARWILIPSVVVEIVAGVVIGPEVAGLVEPGPVLDGASQIGMAMLFFLAGYEIDLRRASGRATGLAAASWAVSFALAAGLAWVAGAGPAVLIVAIGLSSTALGTVLPIARDAGVLSGPVGARLMAVGAVGEFAPIVLVALFFAQGQHSGRTTVAILVAGLAVAAAALGTLRRSERVSRLLSATLGTSVQFAIRLSVLALLASVLLAAEVGVDIALGAFAAGMVMRLILRTISDEEVEQVGSKLDGIGFGWLVPIFFVYTGVTFELGELVSSPVALALLPVFLAAFALVRGAVTWLAFAPSLARPGRDALSWFAACQLPIVVIAADIGASRGLIEVATGSAMVGAAMLSVLLFPLLALRAASRS